MSNNEVKKRSNPSSVPVQQRSWRYRLRYNRKSKTAGRIYDVGVGSPSAFRILRFQLPLPGLMAPYFIIGHSLFDIGYSGRNLPPHIGYSCFPAIMRIAAENRPWIDIFAPARTIILCRPNANNGLSVRTFPPARSLLECCSL